MSALDDILKARGMPSLANAALKPANIDRAPRSGGPPIIYDVIQGSPEWADLRCGIPTASNFHRVLTRGGKKGPQPSSQQWGYKMDLLAERILGQPIDAPKTSWMNHGNEMESEAVSYYELMADRQTKPVGFITNDAGTIGASPDRLVIGTKRGLEIKCPSPGVHMSYLLNEGSAADEYFIQVQGEMLIAELEGVDLVSYFHGLPTAIHQTPRDDDYIKALAEELDRFNVHLAELQARLAAMGFEPATLRSEPPDPNSQRSVMDEMRRALIEVNR